MKYYILLNFIQNKALKVRNLISNLHCWRQFGLYFTLNQVWRGRSLRLINSYPSFIVCANNCLYGMRIEVRSSLQKNGEHFIIPNIFWGFRIIFFDSIIFITLGKVFDAYLIVFFSGPPGTRRRFVFFHHVRGRLKHDE